MISFKRGLQPKHTMEIGVEGQILKYLNQPAPGSNYEWRQYKTKKWDLSDRIDCFFAFYRIANDASRFKEGPIEQYAQMMNFLLEKFPYEVLSKGTRKLDHNIEQGHVNDAGSCVLNLFLNYQDVDEIQELFHKTVKSIRLSNISTGQKTKLLKFFRDDYVKNNAK